MALFSPSPYPSPIKGEGIVKECHARFPGYAGAELQLRPGEKQVSTHKKTTWIPVYTGMTTTHFVMPDLFGHPDFSFVLKTDDLHQNFPDTRSWTGMTIGKVLSPSAVAEGYGGQAVGEDLGEGVIKKT